jgi:hypothetical protein
MQLLARVFRGNISPSAEQQRRLTLETTKLQDMT